MGPDAGNPFRGLGRRRRLHARGYGRLRLEREGNILSYAVGAGREPDAEHKPAGLGKACFPAFAV